MKLFIALILLVIIIIIKAISRINRSSNETHTYTTQSFELACKADKDGYLVKKQLIDGTNLTKFNPQLRNPDNYIFYVFGISNEEYFTIDVEEKESISLKSVSNKKEIELINDVEGNDEEILGYKEYRLAHDYLFGYNDTEIDISKGYEILQESTKLGYCGAFEQIGYFYQNGHGKDSDLKQAKYWFNKGINNGCILCYAYLGYLNSKNGHDVLAKENFGLFFSKVKSINEFKRGAYLYLDNILDNYLDIDELDANFNFLIGKYLSQIVDHLNDYLDEIKRKKADDPNFTNDILENRVLEKIQYLNTVKK
jgi:uncharacterized protein YxeA